MSSLVPGRFLRLATLALGLQLASTSCATLAGTATGAVTGSVDLPRYVYERNQRVLDENPVYWAPLVIVFAPIGVGLGPILGLAKGASIDIQSGIQEMYPYGEAWSEYGDTSVWRPYTFPRNDD